MTKENVFTKVFKNSIFFSIGTLATKAINFLMLPIYTHSMTDTEYGMASTILSFVTTFSLLVLLGLRAAIIRFYPGISDIEKKRRFAGNVFSLILINGILIVGILLVFKKPLQSYLFVDMQFFPLVFLGLLSLIPEALYYAYQSFLQATQSGKAYTLNSIIFMLIYATMNIILIIFFKLGALGMVITMLLTPTIMSIYGIIKMYRKGTIRLNIEKATAKPILKYSLPIVPHDLSSMLAPYVSKILLNNTVSYATTGQYTVSSQISNIMSLVQSSLNLAFHPWFNEQMNNDYDGRKNIKKFSLFIFFVYCYISICVAYFSPEIISILTPVEYQEAWKLVPVLSLALVVNFIYYSHALAIFYNLKASKFISVCSITGSLSNIILSYLLIRNYASWGAAIAYFVARCITAIITVIYSRRVQKVDFGLPRMCIMTISTAVIMAAGLCYGWINNINGFNLTSIIIKVSIILAMTISVLLAEKKLLMEYLHVLIDKRRQKG